SLALALVIDKSGSMADAGKMEMAKEAARSAVEMLGPRDHVGVGVFDVKFHWASEMQPVTDRGRILEQINAVAPGGGTAILPGLQAAFDALVGLGAAAKFKHIILLTDGEDESGTPPE